MSNFKILMSSQLDDKFRMSSSLQEIKQATKRKSNGFFFIKSKHVHPTFKNHTYFQMKPKSYTEQSEPHLSCGQIEDPPPEGGKKQKWSMFVDEPSSYGIENTYRYMCDRIRIANRRNAVLKTLERESGDEKEAISQKHDTIISDHEIQPQSMRTRRQRKRIHSQPGKYLETTQSFNYRIRKSKNLGGENKMKESKVKHSSESPQMAEHLVEMIYIPGKVGSLVGNNSEQGNNRICLNLLPYVVSCFFKCKINYLKKISQPEYDEIKRYIEEIKPIPKNYFDVKDVINLSTIQEVLEILRAYGFGSLEWIETVRYFFMPNEDILAYQFAKMVDEVKVMSIMKFNAEISHQPLYIYRVEDKMKVNNVYDMLRPGTYIYSQNKACYEIYCSILKRKAEAFSYKNRIKKWRNVAPLEEAPCLASAGSAKGEVEGTLEKYQKLFELRKERRKKYSMKKQASNRGIMITAHAHSTFIDKSKLHHSEDIFQ